MKRQLAIMGVIVVGSLIVAVFLYGFIFVIPQRVVTVPLKDWLTAIPIALTFFGLIGWFYWGLQNLGLQRT